VLGEATKSWTDKRREATRTAILDAAWAVAREHGLAALTLREVAARVGMRAPSLYTHFASKHAIYDAMFGQAWEECEAAFAAAGPPPTEARAALRWTARTFFDFAVADLARHQLMNQRVIPDFTPSPQAYAPAVRVLEGTRDLAAAHGITAEEDFDLWIALMGGLADAQWANDPGGTRYARLLDRATDMFADAVGLPATATTEESR
jgi:AcrR family transcriptional regulator